MKTNYIYLGALLLCLTACKKEVKVEEKVVVEKDSVPAEVVKSEPMDSIAMQKAWEEYMTPSEMHKKNGC